MSIVRSGFSTAHEWRCRQPSAVVLPAPKPGFDASLDRDRARRLGDAGGAVRAMIDHDDRPDPVGADDGRKQRARVVPRC